MAPVVWTEGRLIREDELTVPAADRAFEHGLGLFETFRAWDGRPTLLPRHLARMRASASALGLAIDPPVLPDERAVESLRVALDLPGDSRFRITLTGGGPDGFGARLWMRGGPLPSPVEGQGARLVLGGMGLDDHDPLARHKTLNYWGKRLAYERALAQGADEALLGTRDGHVWEATRSNLFLVRNARLTTPGLDGPCLPGVMRGLVLEIAEEVGLLVDERAPDLWEVEDAHEVFLTNAVRGIVPVSTMPHGRGTRDLPAPGPWTARLIERVERLVRGSPPP